MPRPAPAEGAGRSATRVRGWKRILAGLAAGALALLLAGCDITGTVDVRSGKEVVADLTFTNAAVDCLGLNAFAGLTIKGTPDSDGNQLCRAQGTLDLEELRKFGIQVNQLGDYLTVDLAMPSSIGYTPMRIDLRFPGPVTDAGGTTASGNQVRLTTGIGMATTSPTRVVAMAHPGPEWWVIAGVAGFAGGILLTLAVLWALRRARRPAAGDHAADIPDAEELPPSAQAERASDAGAAPPAHPAEAPEPVRDAAYEALFAPPTTEGSAPPDPRPPATRAPPPHAPAADHSVWAPPHDRPDR